MDKSDSLTAPCSVNPAGNRMCPNNVGMTDAERTWVTNAHNEKRSLLARGLIRNGKNPRNKNLPRAYYMPRMTYDCRAEADAIAYAQLCTMMKSDER
ncbi:unnamed protein product, partial [Strongylus vulgaris]